LRIYNDNLINLKFKSAISAIQSGNQVALPPIVSQFNPSMKNSNKSLDNLSGDKSPKQRKAQPHSSNILGVGSLVEQSFHEKVKLWEQNILSPNNRKYDEKSKGTINLNQIKGFSRKKSSKSVILPKVNRRDFSSDNILEKNNVKHILMKIDLLGRVGKNRALSGNKKFKDFIIKQKELLDLSRVNIIN